MHKTHNLENQKQKHHHHKHSNNQQRIQNNDESVVIILFGGEVVDDGWNWNRRKKNTFTGHITCTHDAMDLNFFNSFFF